MGKLYELIKPNLNKLDEYRDFEEKDFKHAKAFPNSFKEDIEIERVNRFLIITSRKLRDKLGNKEFEKLLDAKFENARAYLNIKGVEYTEDYHLLPSIDYEKVLDYLEESLTDDEIEEIKNEFEEKSKIIEPVNKPLEPYVSAIINDMNNIKGIDNDIKEISTKYLNYLKDEIVEKKNNFVEKPIERVSKKRGVIARQHFVELANKEGLNGEELIKFDSNGYRTFDVENTYSKTENDLFKPFLKMETKYSNEFKNKILNLKKLVDSKGFLKESQAGETAFKEYAFMAYFKQVGKINQLVDNQLKLTSDNEKLANLFNISGEAQKLQAISKEYDEVLDYIKDNFDINEVALNDNIYSGRKTSFNGDLSKFKASLPERWDNENAPYGVILNGFLQLVKVTEELNVSLEEFLENPVKLYMDGAVKKLNTLSDAASIKINEAPLGKRIASVLAEDSRKFTPLKQYDMLSRGMEFLYNQCEENEQAYDNMNIVQVTKSYVKHLYISNQKLFGDSGNPNIQSLKNLFAFGNKYDNLYKLSTEYPENYDEKGILANNYDNEVKAKANTNPLAEYRNLMQTVKDTLIGMNDAYKANRNVEIWLSSAVILHAAKEYYKDYLLKNNINPLSIADKKERQEVLDFLKDPVVALKNYYNKPEELFIQEEGTPFVHNFKDLSEHYQELCIDDVTKDSVERFDSSLKYNLRGTLLDDKKLDEITDSIKGGYWERKFDTTSKEFKAVTDSFNNARNKNSNGYGDFTMTKIYAQKYLEHKLPEGKTYNDLKLNEKKRVNFCNAIIRACDSVEKAKKDIYDNRKETQEIKERNDEQKRVNNAAKSSKERAQRLENQHKLLKLKKIELIEAKPKKEEVKEINFEDQIKKDVNEQVIDKNMMENNNNEAINIDNEIEKE